MLTLFTENVETWFFAFAHFHCAVLGHSTAAEAQQMRYTPTGGITS